MAAAAHPLPHQQKAANLARTFTKLLRRKRADAVAAAAGEPGVPDAAACVAGDEYECSVEAAGVPSLSKLKLSGNLGAAYSLDAFFRNATEKKAVAAGVAVAQTSPQVAPDVAKDSLLANLFAGVSAVKAAYAQLQLAQFPYDAEAIQAADAALVAELTKLSDTKRRYLRDPAAAAKNAAAAGHTALFAHAEEQRHLLKTYQITARKLEGELRVKEAEADRARNSLTAELRAERAMEARLHPGRTLAQCFNNRYISYKWLSRNFSVSSNDSKRLLQEFVNKHGDDLKVIYSVSGWLKNNPTSYCVKLTSGDKLEEARKEFKDSCSVQVYSIQACIPKDTAVLWNPEFVQAEELFNQPFDEDNCLRDNRFCGVLNSFVKRTANGKLVSSLPPKPINSVAAAAPLKPSSAPKEQSAKGQQQVLPGSSSPKKVTSNKAEKDIFSALDKAANAPVVKEPSIALQGNKNKAQNGKALPSNGGSLATMWGRASAKPKTPATTNPTVLPSVAVTADAQICAKEEADADSSDDEQAVHYKRGSGANNRKRRAVFDLSDDDEDDNVVAIASPEPPEQCITNPVNEVAQESNPKQENLENKQEVEKDVNGCIGMTDSPDCKTKSCNTANHSGITLKEKNNSPPPNDNKQDHAAETASSSPKRRKVLKTRIDERGREVTEVVWEGEASAGDKAEKNVSNTGAANRATLSSKPQPVAKTEKNNASSKTAGNKKPAKAGTKQGNIMSFFKKV
uniref:DNA polymerase delta subunit 3 n=1 Tax=Oryza punctata TaxID=4537 RepID=A0A0E0JFC8_ORYPU